MNFFNTFNCNSIARTEVNLNYLERRNAVSDMWNVNDMRLNTESLWLSRYSNYATD